IAPVLPTNYEYTINTVEIMKELEKAAQAEMTALADRTKEAGVFCEVEIRVGDVYDEIRKCIDTQKPELVVMGTHGRRGVARWFIGSTTEKLLRHSPVPLLTISGSGEKLVEGPRFRRILVTTDFSEGTPDAL